MAIERLSVWIPSTQGIGAVRYSDSRRAYSASVSRTQGPDGRVVISIALPRTPWSLVNIVPKVQLRSAVSSYYVLDVADEAGVLQVTAQIQEL